MYTWIIRYLTRPELLLCNCVLLLSVYVWLSFVRKLCQRDVHSITDLVRVKGRVPRMWNVESSGSWVAGDSQVWTVSLAFPC